MALLIIAGAYQFTPLKRVCIGYCESPMSFFMRRWSDGTSVAVRMGLWHGLYWLGCWSYFLLMVALGWMNLLWMGLFAGITFGENMWSRGIWIARAAGVGLALTGILVISGMLPSLVSSASSISGDNNGNNKMDMSDADKMNSGAVSNSMPDDNGEDSSMAMDNSNNSSAASNLSNTMSNDDKADQNMQVMNSNANMK